MDTKNIKTYKVLENHDELIIDNNYRYHLYRNCEELTKYKEAIFATSYHNNYWKYRDISGFEHLFNENNEEITKNIKTMVVECYSNGYWKYMSKDGSWKIFNSKNEEATPYGYIAECIVYPNGDIEYKTDKDSDEVYVLTRTN